MMKVLALSRLYLLGSLRRHVYLVVILAGAVLLALPSYVSAFSLGLNAYERVAKEFGLSLIGYVAAAMAILLGSTSVPRETETRALYPILARPISRSGYLLAHYLALAILLSGSILVLGGALTLSLSLKKGAFDSSALLGVYGSLLQALVLAAACLTFSIRCSPALAGTIGAAVFLIGNLSGTFIRFFLVEDRDSVVSATLAKALKGILPNLSLFALKDPSVHDLPLAPGYLPAISYYALAWVILLLLLGRLAFRKVDL